MTDIKDKVENALNEARILILGAQVLLGFQYRAVFESGFEKLSPLAQYLKVIGLGSLLVAIALLMWPATYQQVAESGRISGRLHRFIGRVMTFALLPFALGLGMDFFIAFERVFDRDTGFVAGFASLAVALFFWYGLHILAASRVPRDEGKELTRMLHMHKPQEPGIDEKIKNVLTEIRMVLPGAQALLGFQFAAMMVDGFERLPSASKFVHLGSLGLIAIAVVLLMSPSAYHRIVEGGENTERFHRFANMMMLAAMVFLSAGVVGDLYVVVEKVIKSQFLAAGSAVAFMLLFLGLWFGYTLYRRQAIRRDEIDRKFSSTRDVQAETKQRDAA